MHYHHCSELVESSTVDAGEPGVVVVNDSYAVSQHYRSCFKIMSAAVCHRLLANTILDDAVLPLRQQLVDNVRRMLNDTLMMSYDNFTAKALSANDKLT